MPSRGPCRRQPYPTYLGLVRYIPTTNLIAASQTRISELQLPPIEQLSWEHVATASILRLRNYSRLHEAHVDGVRAARTRREIETFFTAWLHSRARPTDGLLQGVMAVEAVHGSRTLGVHGVVQVCRYVLDKEETQWVGETKLDDVVSFIDRLQRGVSAVASAPAEEQDVLVCIRGVSVLGGKWTVGGGVGVGLLHLGSRPRHLNLTHF